MQDGYLCLSEDAFPDRGAAVILFALAFCLHDLAPICLFREVGVRQPYLRIH